MSTAAQRATAKWQKKAYDEIKVRVPKGQKESLKEHAEKQGESLNAFIKRAIEQAIASDEKK